MVKTIVECAIGANCSEIMIDNLRGIRINNHKGT